MDLFPSNPPIDRRHRARLSPFLSNLHCIKRWIREDQPSTADLKRAVVIEVERGDRMREDAIKTLLVAIQRYERCVIGRKIIKAKYRIIRKHKNNRSNNAPRT